MLLLLLLLLLPARPFSCFALLFFALLCFALVLTARSAQLEPPTGDSVCLTSCRLTLQHALLLDLREF